MYNTLRLDKIWNVCCRQQFCQIRSMFANTSYTCLKHSENTWHYWPLAHHIAHRNSSSCREPTTTASLVTIQLATTNPLCKSLTQIDQVRPTTALTTIPKRSTTQMRCEYPSSSCIPQPVLKSGVPLGSGGTGPLMRFGIWRKQMSSSRQSSPMGQVKRCIRNSLSNAGVQSGGLGSRE
jgi:hypothetical protein